MPMKNCSSLACPFLCVLVALVSIPIQSAPGAKDEAKKPASKPSSAGSTAPEPHIPLSVFVVPSDAKAGKDPFLPTSLRPYGSSQPKGSKPAVIDYSYLILNGIIPSKKLAMVNGRTFSEGEEGEVVVNGVRKKIRCLKVNEESVLVELLPEGERRTLKMRFSAQ